MLNKAEASMISAAFEVNVLSIRCAEIELESEPESVLK